MFAEPGHGNTSRRSESLFKLSAFFSLGFVTSGLLNPELDFQLKAVDAKHGGV